MVIEPVEISTPSQNIALLMGMILEGGERLYDIDRFAKDQTVCELFDVPAAPKDTTLLLGEVSIT